MMRIEKTTGSREDVQKTGSIGDITKGLVQHINQQGTMKTPREISQYPCGTGLGAEPMLKNYTEKYSKIYQL